MAWLEVNMKKYNDKELGKLIKNALGYKTLVRPSLYWLDTQSSKLNSVLGSKKLGLAYGKIYLIAGKETSGKSALAAKLAGLAQKDGADVAWVDGEGSFDGDHVRRQGLHPSKVELFYPEYGEFKVFDGKQKKKLGLEEVEPAEYLFERVEMWMKLKRHKNKKGRLFVVVDSTNSFSPKEEQAAGFKDQNMRTRSSPAVFLNMVTKRFGQLAVHTN